MCIVWGMDRSVSEEAVVGVIRSVLSVHCSAAYRAAGQACCRMMTAFAAPEEVRKSRTAEVCPVGLVETHVVSWRTESAHSQLHSACLFREHHQQEVVSFLCEQSALAQWEQQGCRPWPQADIVAAAVAVVVARSRLHQTARTLVGLGMIVSRQCSLLEDGSVLQSRSSPAAGPRDSSSHDAQLSWLWKMQVHLGCPASLQAQYFVNAPKR